MAWKPRLLGLDDTPRQPCMTLYKAMMEMKEARKVLGNGKSVLNPSLTKIQAWDIVWTELVSRQNEASFPDGAKPGQIVMPVIRKEVLPDWLIKRVRQVCTNKMNPDLEEGMSLLGQEKATEKEGIKTADPFEREFS